MIVGLGCLAHDRVLVTEGTWQAGKGRILRSESRIGGNARTALATVAALGHPAGYLATVGTSHVSDIAVADMQAYGIDVRFVERCEGADPVEATVTITSDGERYIAFDDGSLAATPLPSDETIDLALTTAEVLIVDATTAPPGTVDVVKRASSSGIPIVLDAERISSPAVPELMDAADHVVIPLGFGAQITGRSEAQHIIATLWNDNRTAIVLTDGANGAYVSVTPGDVTHVPTFVVAAVDTTGCGDTFHGAYAWSLARGDSALERVRIASAAAAVLAGLPTGAHRVPTIEQVTHVLAFGETQ